MQKAVLLLTFNRFENIQKVFEQIAIAKPPRLYISSDGARKDKKGEQEEVEKIRTWLLANVNWDCEVKTRFNTENMASAKSSSSAITWFFENEEDGIILEDDTVPHQSFFKFCEELLDKYKDDERVWIISGYNPAKEIFNQENYLFYTLLLTWGWATWRNRWDKWRTSSLNDYTPEMLQSISCESKIINYYQDILLRLQNKSLKYSWDYHLVFEALQQNALCIVPSKNLISNIGVDGVHYQNADNDPRLNMKTYDIFENGELKHPEVKVADEEISLQLFKKLLPHLNIMSQEELLEYLQKELALEKEQIKQLTLKQNSKQDFPYFPFPTYYRYKILRKVTWGKTRKKYKEKYKKLKELKRCIFSKNIKNSEIKSTPKKRSENELVFEQYRSKKRFISEKITFRGHEFIVPDAPSFAYQVKEIFLDNAYKFNSTNEKPIIYDCGSNIGTSLLYFKSLFPHAIIKAFEADKKIYDILVHNTKYLTDITYFHRAVWINEENLSFSSEGADGGSLVNNVGTSIEVQGIRLKELLKNEKNIDFLKLDIEGAETVVLEDCQDSLSHINNIFIEYHSMIEQPQTLNTILSILTNAGFKYYLDAAMKQNQVFVSRKPWANMDLQVNIYAYKI